MEDRMQRTPPPNPYRSPDIHDAANESRPPKIPEADTETVVKRLNFICWILILPILAGVAWLIVKAVSEFGFGIRF
jgi:hypothetical protein